jgi:hypothetical protein
MKTKITIYPHSAVDFITNSSSEIFCRIESKNFIKEIHAYLEKVLGRRVDIEENMEHYPDGILPRIDFSIEWGEDNSTITNDFVNMLNELLDQNIGKDNYDIKTDVYN